MSSQEAHKSTGIRKNSKEALTHTSRDEIRELGRLTGRQNSIEAGEKERLLNAESLLVDTSRQRISTQELIPSFRQKYQLYELIQEVADSKRKLELKNKEIFYLSNQIVSIKDEYSQKILHLQATISENKRELTQLRYAGLKNKRIESQRGDRILDETKKNYELQIHNIKQVQEELIKKLHEQHKREKENMEEKFTSILNLEKRQRASVEELYQGKYKNYEKLVREMQEEIKKLYQQRDMDKDGTRQHQTAVQLVKKEFAIFSEQASEVEKSLRIEVGQLQSKVKLLEQEVEKMNRQKSVIMNQSRLQINELQESNKLLKSEIGELKKLVTLKDKQMQKLIVLNLKSQKLKENIPDPTRACNHQGLIQQLERNLTLKNRENTQLREQLNQWGKYIGFDRTSQQRTLDLLNASSQALQSQQSFASSLRKKIGKFSN